MGKRSERDFKKLGQDLGMGLWHYKNSTRSTSSLGMKPNTVPTRPRPGVCEAAKTEKFRIGRGLASRSSPSRCFAFFVGVFHP